MMSKAEATERLGPPKAGKGRKDPPHPAQSLWKERAHILILDFQKPRANNFLLFSATRFVVLCHGRHRIVPHLPNLQLHLPGPQIPVALLYTSLLHPTPICQQLLFARPSKCAHLTPRSQLCPLTFTCLSPRGRWLFPPHTSAPDPPFPLYSLTLGWCSRGTGSWEEGLGSCTSLSLLVSPPQWQLPPVQASSSTFQTSLLPDLRGHLVPPSSVGPVL